MKKNFEYYKIAVGRNKVFVYIGVEYVTITLHSINNTYNRRVFHVPLIENISNIFTTKTLKAYYKNPIESLMFYYAVRAIHRNVMMEPISSEEYVDNIFGTLIAQRVKEC